MLQNLQRVVAYAQEDEDEFVRRVMENKTVVQRAEQEQAKRTLEKPENIPISPILVGRRRCSLAFRTISQVSGSMIALWVSSNTTHLSGVFSIVFLLL